MEIIKPAEISAKIMTLIDEAEREIIIVSPYNKISGWTKLINRIKKAQEKGIQIRYYSRKNGVKSDNSEEVFNNLGIEPILIDDLHAKIYLNEESAIITSMNLHYTSDQKSIDIGCKTQTNDEYDQVLAIVKKHIIRASFTAPSSGTEESGHSMSDKFQKIDNPAILELFHINGIHQYVFSKNNKCRIESISEEVLEYVNFVQSGYRIQFILHESSIKILIFPPEGVLISLLAQNISKNRKINKLVFPKEIGLSENLQSIKYFYRSNIKLASWKQNQLRYFLEEMDFIISLVFDQF